MRKNKYAHINAHTEHETRDSESSVDIFKRFNCVFFSLFVKFRMNTRGRCSFDSLFDVVDCQRGYQVGTQMFLYEINIYRFESCSSLHRAS